MVNRKKLCSTNDKVHPELTNFFSYCFYKSAIRLRTKIDTATKKHGVIAPQRGVLYLLKKLGAISQNTLGKELGIDKATMVKLIDGLEKKKCVTRTENKQDRREKNIEVTAKGLNFLLVLTRIHQEVEAEFLGQLTENERTTIRTIIPKLLHESKGDVFGQPN